MRIARALLITAAVLLAIGVLAASATPSCSPVFISAPPGHTAPVVVRCYVSVQQVAPATLLGGAALLLLGVWRASVSR